MRNNCLKHGGMIHNVGAELGFFCLGGSNFVTNILVLSQDKPSRTCCVVPIKATNAKIKTMSNIATNWFEPSLLHLVLNFFN